MSFSVIKYRVNANVNVFVKKNCKTVKLWRWKNVTCKECKHLKKCKSVKM